MLFSIFWRRADAIGRLLALATVTAACCNYAAAQSMRNPYESLDVKAQQATSESSCRALFQEIHGRTLFGTLPNSVMARLIRAQLGFVQSGHPTTTESAVADAVNFFGPLLDSAVYTGTNATQIRLLRLSFFFEVRHLLQAANRSAMEPLGDSILSPAGGMFLASLLLRNKLTNPAWYGDPDAQNKVFFTNDPTVRAHLASLARNDSNRLWAALTPGLADETGIIVSTFHRFLDILGIPR